jgi:hypothetical protein
MEEPTSRSFNYSSRFFFYVINRIGRTYTEEETGNSATKTGITLWFRILSQRITVF